MYPISYTMKVEVAFFILGALLPGVSRGLIFREDQFTDMTQECLKSDGKPLRHILNADNPAMYISVDGNHDIKKFKRAERTRLFKKITNDQFNQKHLLQDLADGRSQWLNDLKFITVPSISFYSDFILILSRIYPNFIQILSYVLSRFF